tara:strand:+ start:16086 stop:17678 length:1593 start_codon:yes stop_codon:yes gene_type:complete
MRKFHSYYGVLVVLLWVASIGVNAQNRLYVPFQRQVNLPLQNNLDTLGSKFHPDIFPYQSTDVDSAHWFKEVYQGDFATDKFLLNLNLNRQSKKYPVKLSVSPIGEILTGFESGIDAKSFLQTGIGFNFSAMVGNTVDVNINIMGSNSSFPSFVESFIFANKVIPGQGWGYKSDLGYYYNNSNGYVSYTPGKYFNLTLGRGKNKFGDGYRSLLLSDIGNNQNYFRIVTNIWKFKYVNLFTQMDDVYEIPGAPDVKNKKYGSYHYLSINIKRRWSVGLFESIQWMGQDSIVNRGFDPYYLNPIIFLRPVEFSLGSADNALMGLNLSFKASNNVKFYGQIVLDEFKLSEMTAGTGWWGNKYGTQIGVKYYNAFHVDRLTLQGEYNRVRPYTYSHRVAGQAYGNYNQPLAHPSGANFNEGVFLANYYVNKFYVELKTTLLLQGVDSDSVSYGGNIFKSYQYRPSDYGIEIGQGVKRTLTTVNLKASYLLSSKANIRIEANLSSYNETIGAVSNSIFWARIGLRTGIFNEDWDF